MDIIAWARQNGLLVISAVLALISVLVVPLDRVTDYDYGRILKTIGILLCFLLIISGLRECAVLDRISQSMVGRISTTIALCLVLVFMPFFIAMLFTNDVALVTVVPIAITVLNKAGLVRSSRGPLGGYRLVRAPEEYTAGEIVSSIEGGFAPVACMESETNECPRHQSCATLRLWEKLDGAIRSVMESVTLADLVKWQKELDAK